MYGISSEIIPDINIDDDRTLNVLKQAKKFTMIERQNIGNAVRGATLQDMIKNKNIPRRPKIGTFSSKK